MHNKREKNVIKQKKHILIILAIFILFLFFLPSKNSKKKFFYFNYADIGDFKAYQKHLKCILNESC